MGGRDMGQDESFERIDRSIEDLQVQLDGCVQAEKLSRAAIVVGAIVLALVLTLATAYRTPIVVFGAFTAMLGGLIWLGANRSTRLEVEAELAALDARKARMIDQVAARNGWRDLTATVH